MGFLIIGFYLCAAITTLDKRLIQARRDGTVPADELMLPQWTGVLWWIQSGLFVWIAIIDWKVAILVYIIKFILSVLPVLEIIGNVLTRPFQGPGNRI